ncbi:hypothetical protein HZA26_01730 [Candidatus Nomurabacteria bacterium]|nr:hypothetical protein [Candidatus Nomurabacteria bacterium]
MRQNLVNSPHLVELKKKRRKSFFNKLILYFFLLILSFVSLGFISRLDRLNIHNIQVVGNEVIESAEIEKLTRETFSSHYLYFFPKSNFLFYPKRELINNLVNKFKILKEVKIDVVDIETLEISVVERKAGYTWCGESLIYQSKKVLENECYFTDDEGYIYSTAPYFSGNVYFKFFGPLNKTDEGSDKNPLGVYFVPEIFKKVTALVGALKYIVVSQFLFFDKDSEKFEIYLENKSDADYGPKIILKKDFQLEKVVNDLQAALDAEPLKTDFEKKYSSLLYIDLTIPNKVYYKFTEEGSN